MVDWGYVSGRIRSYENYLLDYNTIIRWSDADDVSVLLKYMKDSVYADVFNEENVSHYEEVLEQYQLDMYDELSNLIPEDELLKIHNLTYDLNNIKIIFKSKFTNADIKWEALSEKGTIPPEELFTILEEERYFKLPGSVGKVFPRIEQEFLRTENVHMVDLMIDQSFNEYRFELVKSKPIYHNIINYYSAWVDMENIKNILRTKLIGFERGYLDYIILNHGHIPRELYYDIFPEQLPDIVETIKASQYGERLDAGLTEFLEYHHFSTLEREMDELMMETIRPFRYISQGPEVVEEYLALKDLEMKNLKIVIIGILNNFTHEQLKRRIRNNGF